MAHQLWHHSPGQYHLEESARDGGDDGCREENRHGAGPLLPCLSVFSAHSSVWRCALHRLALRALRPGEYSAQSQVRGLQPSDGRLRLCRSQSARIMDWCRRCPHHQGWGAGHEGAGCTESERLATGTRRRKGRDGHEHLRTLRRAQHGQLQEVVLERNRCELQRNHLETPVCGQ